MFHIALTPYFCGFGVVANGDAHLYGIHFLWFSLVFHVGCKGHQPEETTEEAE